MIKPGQVYWNGRLHSYATVFDVEPTRVIILRLKPTPTGISGVRRSTWKSGPPNGWVLYLDET